MGSLKTQAKSPRRSEETNLITSITLGLRWYGSNGRWWCNATNEQPHGWHDGSTYDAYVTTNGHGHGYVIANDGHGHATADDGHGNATTNDGHVNNNYYNHHD